MPLATWVRREPATSITPQPRFRNPGSMPITRILPPFSCLATGLARKGNIRQWLSGARRPAPPHFALAEIDDLLAETDARPAQPERAEKDDKIVTTVMQWLQGGLALPSLALHMQHDYLAVMKE